MEKAQDKIRDWLDAEGRKSKWLAAKIPATESTLSRWLNGKDIPSTVYRRRLQDITGLPVAEAEAWE